VLTPDERQRLDFLRQSGGTESGLRPALLDAAINGASLDPAVAKRAREFLAGQRS
jgi:hypothetical protein